MVIFKRKYVELNAQLNWVCFIGGVAVIQPLHVLLKSENYDPLSTYNALQGRRKVRHI